MISTVAIAMILGLLALLCAIAGRLSLAVVLAIVALLVMLASGAGYL